MLVKQFSYKTGNLDSMAINQFVIEPVELGMINLLVGKNASGKTTLSNCLNSLANMLNTSGANYVGEWDIQWVDGDDVYAYHYYRATQVVDVFLEEKLTGNGKLLFSRANEKGQIFSHEWNQLEDIYPPIDKHILGIRRDEKQYPYLEKIASWAKGVHAFKFGHIHAPTYGFNYADKTSLPSTRDKDFNKILGELDEEIKAKVISDFNSLGYEVQILSIRKEGEQNVFYIKEGELKFEIRYSNLSQGMFRSLSLLIFIHFLVDKEHSKLIIIDDLCEGLDYDRTTRLGKILFSRMEEKGIQFVATSNDSFLMNVVDIKYWNVIHRDRGVIKSFNYNNSKKKFDKFKMTGLNNFDLFSSNFLSQDEENRHIR